MHIFGHYFLMHYFIMQYFALFSLSDVSMQTEMDRRPTINCWYMHCVSVFILAADIDEALLRTLSQEDLKELFPERADFGRRKRLWALIHPEVI